MKKLFFLILAIILTETHLFAQNNNSSITFNNSLAKQLNTSSGGAFPYNSAGITAYTQVPADSIDIIKGVQAFSKISEVGDNYALGTVGDVNLYFDNAGWVISYYPRGYEPSRMVNSFDSNIINNNNLLATINIILDTMNISKIYPVQYTDLEHLAADSMLIFYASGLKTVYFEIPNSYNVFSQSVRLYLGLKPGSYGDVGGKILVDGNVVIYNHTEWPDYKWSFEDQNSDSFVTASIGSAHTINIQLVGIGDGYYPFSFAYVIIYSH